MIINILIMRNKSMKLFLTCFSVVTVLALSGCGGSDSESSIDLDAKVLYKTAAEYDLKDYVAPSENTLKTYRELTYVNNDGKKSFKGDPDEEITVEKYDINGNTIVVKDKNDAIDEIYIIKTDRIENKDDLNDTTPDELARYVDIGDYVFVDNQSTDFSNQIPIQGKTACKVTKHYATKELNKVDYNDVLKIECQVVANGETTANGILIKYSYDVTEESYHAKGLGEVYSESISCQDVKTTINKQTTTNSTCEKETTSLISANKI
jgi:hypothetical protein